MGSMYGNGWGVPQDNAEAVKWYRRAAEQGHTSAQFHLGVMYSMGRGVPQDNVQAYAWLLLATEQDSDVAGFAEIAKDVVAGRMTRDELARAIYEALQYERGIR